MSLLFPRPGELRAAEWTEFDTEKSVWTIPAERTKLRRAHKVPLSRQALVVLSDLRRITGHGRLAFPSVRTITKPISENTLNAALRRLGYGNDEATSHGFRASAATLLNETGRWNADAIERQLAHIERNDVRRAYARGEHWDERVRMTQWWADYLDDLKQVGKIISIGPNGRSRYLNRITPASIPTSRRKHRGAAPFGVTLYLPEQVAGDRSQASVRRFRVRSLPRTDRPLSRSLRTQTLSILRSLSNEATRTRRRRPMVIVSISPPPISSYSFVRPSPTASQASAIVHVGRCTNGVLLSVVAAESRPRGRGTAALLSIEVRPDRFGDLS